MKITDHYEKVKEFHRARAVENDGYYDAIREGEEKHTVWQVIIRKMIIKEIDKLLSEDPHINNLIDVCCGRGDFTIELAKRYPALTQVYGCDFVKEMLSIAKRDGAQIKNITFQEANLLNLHFSDNSFDLTTCINVIHAVYKEDLEKALSELARVTNKYLIIEIKNIENIYFKYIFSNDICGMKIYPNSTIEISNILNKYNFKLIRNRSIFLFNWMSPLIVLVYEKQV